MIRLLLIFRKLQPLLLFLVLEIVLFNVFLSQNAYQRAKVVAASHWLGGAMKNWTNNVSNFFELSDQNAMLVRENARLHAQLSQMGLSDSSLVDLEPQEAYRVVKVVNNSFTSSNNFITISGGRMQGISPDMALFNSEGIVGYVKYSSDNFSVAVSVLNLRDFRTSGKFVRDNSAGSIRWDGVSYRDVVMEEISSHTPIELGDTVVTTQYSNIFPEGIPIGVVREVTKGRNELLVARLELLADFSTLNYLYAVSLDGQREREELEKQIE